MTFPGFNAEASLHRSRQMYSGVGALGQAVGAIRPASCSIWKKAACAGALAACAYVCAQSGGVACAACFAGVGASPCIDCL
jgi:hypothetical protein